MTTSSTLARDIGYADRLRDYRVVVDSTEIGRVADGEGKVFRVTPGTHTLGLRVLLAPFYLFLWNRYLWLKQDTI